TAPHRPVGPEPRPVRGRLHRLLRRVVHRPLPRRPVRVRGRGHAMVCASAGLVAGPDRSIPSVQPRHRHRRAPGRPDPGSGRAPAAATVEAVRSGISSDRMPTFGPLTVTVPGAVEGWFTLLERFGTLPFSELAGRALRYARDGFPISAMAAASIARARAR